MTIRPSIPPRSRVLATILAAAAIAAAASMATAAPGPAAARPPRPAAAGLLIGIDPVTGVLGVPDAAQRARLEALTPRLTDLTARPAPVYHANGSASMNVRSWMREYSLARATNNARPSLGCVDGESAARAALRHVPKPEPASGSEER